MAFGVWRLAAFGVWRWRLAFGVGVWRLEFSAWRLAFGAWVSFFRPGRAEVLPMLNWVLQYPLALPISDIISRDIGMPALLNVKVMFLFYKIEK